MGSLDGEKLYLCHKTGLVQIFFFQLSTFLQDLFLLQSKGRKVSCNLDKTMGGFFPNEPVVSFFFWIRLLV